MDLTPEDQKKQRQRGDCSACGRSIELKADGTVRHHGGEKRSLWPYRREYRCWGTDRLPKGAQDQRPGGE